MKQRILIFCTVLATLGLTAFGVINWNDSETNQLEAPVNENLVMHTVALEKTNKSIFTDFVYHVGPRFAPMKKGKTETGKIEDDYSSPHLTIVPKKQAKYVYGKYALIEYLNKNSKEAIANVQKDRLRPAKLYFTVTKKGTIENVIIGNHSGYPVVDKTMIELISNTHGEWEPAENAKGEKVNQELVISFGLMGC